MPTILLILGWRLFFYANEGNEPIHIHCRKGEKECKYWIDRENFDLEEAYTYNISTQDRREIKKLIFEHLNTLSNNGRNFSGGLRMKKHHQITEVQFKGDFIVLTIDGQKKKFKVSEISSVLHQASE